LRDGVAEKEDLLHFSPQHVTRRGEKKKKDKTGKQNFGNRVSRRRQKKGKKRSI